MLLSTIAWCVGKCPDSISIGFLGRLVRLSTLTIPIWACAVASIKLSAICMLLRFQQGIGWKIFLYGMGAIQVAFALGNLIWLLGFFCRPFSAAYSQNLADAAKCFPARAMRIASNTAVYTNLATDLILSLVPLSFLVNLRRSLQERILVCILMATGLLASAASISKMLQIRSWNAAKAQDAQIALSSLIEIWTVLEMFLGITATCLPYLKSWCQGCLVRINILSGTLRAPSSLYLREITVSEQISEGPEPPIEKMDAQIQEVSSRSSDTPIAENTTTISYPGQLGGGA